MSKKPKVYLNGKGQVIGTVTGEVMQKSVRKSKHLLRAVNGYGWDTAAITQARDAGVKELIVLETENKVAYRVSIKRFIDKGIEFNFGYGEQLVLPLQYWLVGKDYQLRLA